MSTQKALYLPKVGDQFTLGTSEIFEPGPGEVLVKVEASGLNPLDWKVQQSGIFFITEFPVILGDEGAGVVVKVGQGVTNVVKGDKVFFLATFDNKHMTFQEYVVADAEIVAKIPHNISFDQAASISAGFHPFALATYAPQPQGIGYTAPFEQGGLGKYVNHPIVIMGGASSLGQYGIQLARLSGFSPIIATASLANKDLLVSLGATHVVDRKLSADALKERVSAITTTPIPYVFDAISIAETQHSAFGLLAPGGTLAVVTPPQVKSEEGPNGRKVFLVFGSFNVPQNREVGTKFLAHLPKWLEEGKIKTTSVEVLPGGLNGVAAGLEKLRSGSVSAKKLVVHPSETK